MKSFYAYIRVSTTKQGEHGVSLSEQRDAIAAFAARNNITITEWFEERETAAKLGRREFARMLGLLNKRRADGVVFHKIDRSARNLKDWSVVQDLTERGIEVRFAHEPIDLSSSAGQLTGDFMAVIATHYIRNLREEVKKGIRGRLKQGLYPFAAPIGYLDQGGGKPKVPDPERAPFIRLAFELYGCGQHTLRTLCAELYSAGLRTKTGKRMYPTLLQMVLRNPFYAGIVSAKNGEAFRGVHEPIISMQLFEAVQAQLDRKANAKVTKHAYLFRRMIRCTSCRRALIGERQKGHVYYRCHTRACSTKGLREEFVDAAIREALVPLTFTEKEVEDMRAMFKEMQTDLDAKTEERQKAAELQKENLRMRLSRLIDAYLDGSLDKDMFERRKRDLLIAEAKLENTLSDGNPETTRTTSLEKLELLSTLRLSYEIGKPVEKRELLQMTTSNLTAEGKYVGVELLSPYREVARTLKLQESGLSPDRPRTESGRKEQLRRVVEIIAGHDISGDGVPHDGAFGQSGAEAS